MQVYCLACKTFTDNANSKTVKINDKLMLKSVCTICGNKKFKFISKGPGLTF